MALASCYDPGFRDGQFRCGNAGCPSGMVCGGDGWCHDPDWTGPDAAVADPRGLDGAPQGDADAPDASSPPDATTGASERF